MKIAWLKDFTMAGSEKTSGGGLPSKVAATSDLWARKTPWVIWLVLFAATVGAFCRYGGRGFWAGTIRLTSLKIPASIRRRSPSVKSFGLHLSRFVYPGDLLRVEWGGGNRVWARARC